MFAGLRALSAKIRASFSVILPSWLVSVRRTDSLKTWCAPFTVVILCERITGMWNSVLLSVGVDDARIFSTAS